MPEPTVLVEKKIIIISQIAIIQLLILDRTDSLRHNQAECPRPQFPAQCIFLYNGDICNNRVSLKA